MNQDIDETRMSLGEHLEELRAHVLRAVLYLFVALVIAMNFQEPLMRIATWPHRSTMERIARENQLERLHGHLSGRVIDLVEDITEARSDLEHAVERSRQLEETLRLRLETDPEAQLRALGVAQAALREAFASLETELLAALDDPKPERAQELEKQRAELEQRWRELSLRSERAESLRDRAAGRSQVKVRLQQLSYPEAFMSYLKVCFVLAFFVAGPLMGRELWRFVEKGLYPHEKRWVNIIAPASFGAFACGIVFGYFILIPYGLYYLATFPSADIVEGSITLGEYLSLFITLTLVVGLFFQLPLIMSFLTLIHVIDDRRYREFRKGFYMGSIIVSAVMTPPDPVTQILMWLPLIALYEIGIWISWLIRSNREERGDGGDPSNSPAPLPPGSPTDSSNSSVESISSRSEEPALSAPAIPTKPSEPAAESESKPLSEASSSQSAAPAPAAAIEPPASGDPNATAEAVPQPELARDVTEASSEQADVATRAPLEPEGPAPSDRAMAPAEEPSAEAGVSSEAEIPAEWLEADDSAEPAPDAPSGWVHADAEFAELEARYGALLDAEASQPPGDGNNDTAPTNRSADVVAEEATPADDTRPPKGGSPEPGAEPPTALD